MFHKLKRFLPSKKNQLASTTDPIASQNIRQNANAYPLFPPPPPEELLDQRDDYENKLREREFLAPIGETEDTPLFGMYRLYEHLVLNRRFGLRNELEMFWYNRWPVSSIPDPMDSAEPARYAVLACVTALMVTAYNERIRMGIPRWAEAIMSHEELEEARNAEKQYEEIPGWAMEVQPLKETLKIPHDDGGILESFDDERASRELSTKNILHWQPHIHFI